LIEPIAAVVVSPNVGSQKQFPNEDSQAFEFDESNLFSYKRFPGYDRFAGGSRVDYGVNVGMFDDMGRGGKLFVGQSYRAREDNTYQPGSGLENHISDVVGKLEVNPSKNLDLIYRFRINTDQWASRRSELSANTKIGPLKLGVDYILLDRLAGNGEFTDREQIGTRAALKLSNDWVWSANLIGDLNNKITGKDYSTRLFSTGFTYHNDCFSTGLNFERDFTDDGENRPGSAIMFRVDFKNLGGEVKEDYFTPVRGNAITGTLLP
jgi:LPS-assembly protein